MDTKKQPDAFRLIDELENAALGFHITGDMFRCQNAKGAIRMHIAELKAQLEAQAQPVEAPKGWQMVPIEPTEAMWIAYDWTNGDKYTGRVTWEQSWIAMLAAAPQPAAQTQNDAKDAALWRALQSIPKVDKLLWQYVLSDEMRDGHDSVEQALVAITSQKGNHD